MDKDTMRLLFTAIVRPYLEFENVVWYPKYKTEEEMDEQVQERATKSFCVSMCARDEK